MWGTALALMALLCSLGTVTAQVADADSVRMDSLYRAGIALWGEEACVKWCDSDLFPSTNADTLVCEMYLHLSRVLVLTSRTVDKLVAANSQGSWHQLVTERMMRTNDAELKRAQRCAKRVLRACDNLQIIGVPRAPVDTVVLGYSVKSNDPNSEWQFRMWLAHRFKLKSVGEEDYVIRRLRRSRLSLEFSHARSDARAILVLKSISEYVYATDPVGLPQLK